MRLPYCDLGKSNFEGQGHSHVENSSIRFTGHPLFSTQHLNFMHRTPTIAVTTLNRKMY